MVLCTPKKQFMKNYFLKEWFESDDKGGICMAIGFVLIRAEPTHEHEVYNQLATVPEIVELHLLFGEYDIIAKIEVEDFEKLGSTVVKKIRSIEGVRDTKTLTGVKL